MQLLDILRAIHGTPCAAEQSFTASMIQGAERVMALVKKESAELSEQTTFATVFRETIAKQDAEIVRLKQEASASDAHARDVEAHLEAARANVKAARDIIQRAFAELPPAWDVRGGLPEQIAAALRASDAHASAMEEATMRAMDVEAAAKEIRDEVDASAHGLSMGEYQAILRKHFRAAPAVDRNELVRVIYCLGIGQVRSEEIADAVLSFLGAGASDVVLQSHAVDAGPLAQLQHAELHRLLAPVLDAAAFAPGQETAEKAIERLLFQWRSGLQPRVPFSLIDGSFGDITRPDWLDIPFSQPFATPVLMVEGAEHVRAYAVSLERTIESLRQAQASGKPRDPLMGESCQACVLGAGAEEPEKRAVDLVSEASVRLAERNRLAAAAREKMDERGPITAEWIFEETFRLGMTWTVPSFAALREQNQEWADRYVKLAESINARIVPPAPAPQESDVESEFLRYREAQQKAGDAYCANDDDKREWSRVEFDAAREFFRAHRVVELPKRPGVGPLSYDATYLAGFYRALIAVKQALDRAGIAHRSET